MATTILKNIKEAKNRKPSQHLQNAISYIMNPEKTEKWALGRQQLRYNCARNIFINDDDKK